MSSHLILATLLESNIAEIFQSPFIVPCFGTIMILGIAVAGIWSGVRTREMQSQERLAAIAKGLPPELIWNASSHQKISARPSSGEVLNRSNSNSNARRAGILLVSIGLGMTAFFVALAMIVQVRGVLVPAAAGLIPCAIGIGFLIDARVRAAELNHLQANPGAYGDASAYDPAGIRASDPATTSSNFSPLH